MMNKIEKIKKDIKEITLVAPEYLNYRAAAKYIGRSYAAVKMMVTNGKIPKHGNDKRVYLKISDLDLFMQGKLNSDGSDNRASSESFNNEKGEGAPNSVQEEQEGI